MIVKIHKSYRDIVAICDSELIGKKFEEEIFQLDIKENFFNGEKFSKQEVLKIIENFSKEDATFNIVGKKSVETAIEAKIISEKDIKKIKDIPFSLVLI